jgi:hypothetical protein
MKRIQAINVRVFLGLYLVFYRLMGHFLTPLRSLAVLCVPNFPESREPEPWQSATAQGIHIACGIELPGWLARALALEALLHIDPSLHADPGSGSSAFFVPRLKR